MKYLKSRLKEKSTLTAIVGLGTVTLYHIPAIPSDIVNALSLVVIAIFSGSAASEG
jgi:hypothetical protein